MTASITITLSDEILKVLHAERSITVALDSAGASGRQGRAPRAAKGGKASRKAPSPGGYRAGSLPEKLVKWAGARKEPFGVPEVMRTLGVKRAHASMLLTRVMASGDLKRVGRGAYAAA